MKDIVEIQNNLVQEFAIFEDRMDKYEHIIEIGKKLPQLPDSLKVDDALVKGCQSKVWLHTKERDGRLYFKADSEAIIVRGLVAMLMSIFSGRKAQEILTADLFFIDKIGLKDMLSMTRSNGLTSMIKQIKYYALAYQSVNS